MHATLSPRDEHQHVLLLAEFFNCLKNPVLFPLCGLPVSQHFISKTKKHHLDPYVLLQICLRFLLYFFKRNLKKIFHAAWQLDFLAVPRTQGRPWARSLDSLVETLSTRAGLGPQCPAGRDSAGCRPRQSQPEHRVLLCIFELNLDSQKSYKNSAKFPRICHAAWPHAHVLHDQSVASKGKQRTQPFLGC